MRIGRMVFSKNAIFESSAGAAADAMPVCSSDDDEGDGKLRCQSRLHVRREKIRIGREWGFLP
jgi:hypothetical protein